MKRSTKKILLVGINITLAHKQNLVTFDMVHD